MVAFVLPRSMMMGSISMLRGRGLTSMAQDTVQISSYPWHTGSMRLVDMKVPQICRLQSAGLEGDLSTVSVRYAEAHHFVIRRLTKGSLEAFCQ